MVSEMHASYINSNWILPFIPSFIYLFQVAIAARVRFMCSHFVNGLRPGPTIGSPLKNKTKTKP